MRILSLTNAWSIFYLFFLLDMSITTLKSKFDSSSTSSNKNLNQFSTEESTINFTDSGNWLLKIDKIWIQLRWNTQFIWYSLPFFRVDKRRGNYRRSKNSKPQRLFVDICNRFAYHWNTYFIYLLIESKESKSRL